MSDDSSRLLVALSQLRAELDAASGLDPAVTARLKDAIADVERASTTRGRGPVTSSLTKRLSEAALDFEATHPTLAGTVGSVVDALGRMGI